MRQQEVTFGSQDHIDDLRTQHRGLEQRLRQLDRHRSLSPEEHYEIQVIKKRKLALKDQITRMEARH